MNTYDVQMGAATYTVEAADERAACAAGRELYRADHGSYQVPIATAKLVVVPLHELAEVVNESCHAPVTPRTFVREFGPSVDGSS